jgi:hypothetical protein
MSLWLCLVKSCIVDVPLYMNNCITWSYVFRSKSAASRHFVHELLTLLLPTHKSLHRVYVRWNIIICTHHQILLGGSNQEEWGGQRMWPACERGETCTEFWWESPKGKDHLKDKGVDGRMGSKWILGRLEGVVEWLHLAQDRDHWRALVNAVMNLRVLAPRS